MHDLFLEGVAHFNAHDFFECHDCWEELWMDTIGHDKLFYQGMIQVAVGYYHASHGNFTGARSLFDKALPKLRPYAPLHRRVDLATLLPVFETHAAAFEQSARGILSFDSNNAPTIHLVDNSVS